MIQSNVHIEGRTAGAAAGWRNGLSRLQMRSLITLAREAFFYLCEEGTLGESAEFDAWRHEQTLLVTERAGFRECRNEDFLPLKQHFLRLAGRVEEANVLAARSEQEARTWAAHALQQACTEVADVMPHAINYALGILRKKGMDLDNASPRMLYRALYTVKRRARQLEEKQGHA